jgi:carbohydrate kinase (thermoresistant glucokinase family)
MNLHIIVMGVSGSGKSTVGEKLAEALNLPFLEGDSLHPKSNVDKMASGIPLQDEDRWPWLDKIGERMAVAEQGLIVSCSSLKKSYRDCLRAAVGGQLAFVFLDGSFEQCWKASLPRWKARLVNLWCSAWMLSIRSRKSSQKALSGSALRRLSYLRGQKNISAGTVTSAIMIDSGNPSLG